MSQIKNICIVGGGSAGWLTLSYLSAVFPLIQFTIIEPNDKSAIGVGESTTPQFGRLLDFLEKTDPKFSKQELLDYCNYVNKSGVLFKNWGSIDKDWYHPIGTAGIDVQQTSDALETAESSSKFFYETISDNYKICVSENGTVDTNSYHVEALLLADFLRNYSIAKDNVTRIESTVVDVTKDSTLDKITSIELENKQSITADLFIDCTGFQRRLFDKSSYVKFKDLLCNSAWATHIPIEAAHDKHLHSYTVAHAMPHGWIWEIRLQGSIGTGYVFSDKHVSADEARDEFEHFWKERSSITELAEETKLLKFQSGILSKVGGFNYVALGLSLGFIEPLEATGIQSFIIGAQTIAMISEQATVWDRESTTIYQRHMHNFLRIVNYFIKYHYCASDRCDTEFWREYQASYKEHEIEKITQIIVDEIKNDYTYNSLAIWVMMFDSFARLRPYSKLLVSAATKV